MPLRPWIIGLIGAVGLAASATADAARLPKVSGYNLLKEKVSLPDALPADRTLVLIAFERAHQRDVDTWFPAANTLKAQNAGFDYLELPTIGRWPAPAQAWLAGVMRDGIPDPEKRRRTITLHVNKNNFREALAIPDETKIHALLVDRAGAVLWRAEGPATDAAINALQAAVTGETAAQDGPSPA